MSKYEKLDALILREITIQKNGAPLMTIMQGDVSDEARRIARACNREGYRVLNGRLQALRKGRKIEYDNKAGWKLVSKITI